MRFFKEIKHFKSNEMLTFVQFYHFTSSVMKKITFILALMATLAACQESLEERALREAQEYTRKFCPQRVDENSTLDSLTFDTASQTFTRYFTVAADSQSVERAHQMKDRIEDELITGIKNDTSIKPFKDGGFSFRFIARADFDPTLILYDTTVKADDYR